MHSATITVRRQSARLLLKSDTFVVRSESSASRTSTVSASRKRKGRADPSRTDTSDMLAGVDAENAVPAEVPVPDRTAAVAKKRVTSVVHSETVAVAANVDVDVQAAAEPSKRRGKASKASVSASVSVSTSVSVDSRADSEWLVGAHVGSAGGSAQAPLNARLQGCRSFALFLRPSQSWYSKPLADDEPAKFRLHCEAGGYRPDRDVLPHGIYLVNLCSPDPITATRSRETFLDEMRRCHALGIGMLNIHPGSRVGGDLAPAIAAIAAAINEAHAAVPRVTVVLENMAGQGTVVGSRFEDLRDIIVQVKDKSRVGVCLDTCHAFAAGYDIRTAAGWQRVLDEFDRVVGLHYLRALHLNDSKGLPLILETPPCPGDEIGLLYGLQDRRPAA